MTQIKMSNKEKSELCLWDVFPVQQIDGQRIGNIMKSIGSKNFWHFTLNFD